MVAGDADEELVGIARGVLQHVGVDGFALIEVEAQAGEVLQPQVPIAVDHRVGQPRVEIRRVPA